ncbi:MAG: TIGR01440 family protein [Clostridia bacterium]|nr:TIGR01440 family protein [Clostridia bacterium]
MNTEESIRSELREALLYLKEKGNLQPGARVVIGCSTSEVAGGTIGKHSVPELGEVIADEIITVCGETGLVPVFQCCEHLNRCLVMDRRAAKEDRAVRVNAVPQPKAGGSVPAAAWKQMEDPVLIMSNACDAGMDIGDTLIGMHLRPVAVPLRCEKVRKIGEAHLVMAWCRLPYVGGSRTVYGDNV